MEEIQALITGHLGVTAMVLLHLGFAWYVYARLRSQGREIRALQAAEVQREARAMKAATGASAIVAARLTRVMKRVDDVEDRMSEIDELAERGTLLPRP